MVRRSTLMLALLLALTTVLAQGPGSEIEAHAGGALTGAPSGGTATIPAPGSTFTTVTGPDIDDFETFSVSGVHH